MLKSTGKPFLGTFKNAQLTILIQKSNIFGKLKKQTTL